MECQSLIILSSSNYFWMDPSNGVKYYNIVKESTKKDPIIPTRNLKGTYLTLSLKGISYSEIVAK